MLWHGGFVCGGERNAARQCLELKLHGRWLLLSLKPVPGRKAISGITDEWPFIASERVFPETPGIATVFVIECSSSYNG